MVIQNFTQYATTNGYPSDYDILDHGDLSPSGYVSKSARKAAQARQTERANLNQIAHNEYTKAIIAGTVIDPSGEVTKEKLLALQQRIDNASIQSKRTQLESSIALIESLGKMSHRANGKLKPTYQQTINHYNAELASLEIKK